MSIKILCSKADLVKAAKHFSIAIKGNTKKSFQLLMNINVEETEIELSTIGISYKLPCIANKKALLSAPVKYFFMAVKNIADEKVIIEVEVNRLKIGKVVLGNPTVKIESPFQGFEQIELPLNYTDTHLLLLKNFYSKSDLEKQHLTQLIEKAEERLTEQIDKAWSHLHEYGITKSDLKHIAEISIKIKTGKV